VKTALKRAPRKTVRRLRSARVRTLSNGCDVIEYVGARVTSAMTLMADSSRTSRHVRDVPDSDTRGDLHLIFRTG